MNVGLERLTEGYAECKETECADGVVALSFVVGF